MSNIQQKDVILFDLDGTLLPVDFEALLQNYFQLLTEEFSDLMDGEEFIGVLMKATEVMIKNDGKKTNQEVFMESFFALIEVEKEEQRREIRERFDYFYKEKFPLLQNDLNIDKTSVEIINLFKETGKELVIATNPLFPRRAIVERMKWAGLDPQDFSLITSYENMHYSKPNLEYYREITDKLNVNSTNCAIVGNDLYEDMIAEKLGMTTFLIDDFLIEAGETGDITPDWQGSLVQFKSFVEENLV